MTMFFMAGLQRGLASCGCHRWPGGAAARVTPSCRSGLSVPVCSLQSRRSCRTTGRQLVSDLYCSLQARPGEEVGARRAWAWSWGLARGRRGAGRTRPGRLRRHKPRSPGPQAGRPKCQHGMVGRALRTRRPGKVPRHCSQLQVGPVVCSTS